VNKLSTRLSIGLLAVGAIAFAAFGIQWLAAPHAMAQPLGIVLTNADATSDARAVYGGMEIGFGLFLAYCAFSATTRRTGLIGGMLALFGLGLARLAGIVVAPEAVSAGSHQLLAMDLGGAVLFAFGVGLTRR